jgi:hypothetical protein
MIHDVRFLSVLFGGERLICCVTGSGRFSQPNHATNLEIFLGKGEKR